MWMWSFKKLLTCLNRSCQCSPPPITIYNTLLSLPSKGHAMQCRKKSIHFSKRKRTRHVDPSLPCLPSSHPWDYSCVLQVQNNNTLNNSTCKENLSLDIHAHSSSGNPMSQAPGSWVLESLKCEVVFNAEPNPKNQISPQLWCIETRGFLWNSKSQSLKHTILLSSNWAALQTSPR